LPWLPGASVRPRSPVRRLWRRVGMVLAAGASGFLSPGTISRSLALRVQRRWFRESGDGMPRGTGLPTPIGVVGASRQACAVARSGFKQQRERNHAEEQPSAVVRVAMAREPAPFLAPS